MSEGSQTLRHAVRPVALAKYLGQLSLILAMLSTVPLAVSLYFHEYDISLSYLFTIPLLLFLFYQSTRLPTPSQLQQNEALVIVALTFVLAPLFSSFAMTAAGLDWGEALFESISAITTTGLSTVERPEGMPHTFLFARAWQQWYGGLGIVVLSIALMTGHQAASRRLAEPPVGEGVASTTRTYARRILGVYLLLTLLAVVVLLLTGMAPFSAVTHTLSAISTGGFSPYSDSIAHFQLGIQAILVMLFGLSGAVPLHIYYRVRQRGLTTTLSDPELRSLLLITLAVCASLSLLLHQHGMSWMDALFHGLIQGISSQSTTGFSTLPVDSLDNASKLILIASMLIGGGLGSTSGGIKILRLLMLLRIIQLLLHRTSLPSHAISQPRLSGRTLEAEDIQGALLLMLLFLLVVVASWFAFVLCGYPPLDSLFEVVSATATVGLSSGITSNALEPGLQAILCLDMLLGRLEIVALLVVLYPPTWFAKRTDSA